MVQRFMVLLFSIFFALIMLKVFANYNAVCKTKLLTIRHGRTKFEAYCLSCKHCFSIRSGGLKSFCFVFVASPLNNIFVLAWQA